MLGGVVGYINGDSTNSTNRLRNIFIGAVGGTTIGFFLPSLFRWGQRSIFMGGVAADTSELIAHWSNRPNIYGILHPLVGEEPEHLSYHRGLIDAAYARGARSIGLELCPATLGNPIATTHFKELAEYAQGLGLKVVCLDSNETFKNRIAVSQLARFVTDEGKFDRVGLEKTLASIRASMSTRQGRGSMYYAPEQVSPLLVLRDRLERYERYDAMLRRINDQVDRYGALWEEWVLQRTEGQMRSVLVATSPDIVFVGKGHLKGLEGIGRYRLTDAQTIPGRELRPPVGESSNLYAVLLKVAEERTPEAAQAIYQRLGKMVTELADQAPGRDLIDRIMERSFAREPALDHWLVRATWHDDPMLSSDLESTDIPFMRFPISVARRRVEETIRAAM